MALVLRRPLVIECRVDYMQGDHKPEHRYRGQIRIDEVVVAAVFRSHPVDAEADVVREFRQRIMSDRGGDSAE